MQKLIQFKIFVALFLSLSFATAKEIVEVRLSIPLSESEAQIKDYYISTEGLSLKVNQVVKAVRKVNVQSTAQKAIGEIQVEIGQLKIISVADKVAVAREYKLNSRESTPLTEAIGIMIGDSIDTKDSFTDKNSSRKPSGEDATSPAVIDLSSPKSASRAPNGDSSTLETPEAVLIKPLPGIH